MLKDKFHYIGPRLSRGPGGLYTYVYSDTASPAVRDVPIQLS